MRPVRGNGGGTTDLPSEAYAELYAAHQVHALAQLLIQRLQCADADPQAEQSPAPAQPLKYWYP